MDQMSNSERANIVIDNIRNRRTVPYLKVKPDPIDEAHLKLLFEAANWAPSHKHTEPWRFTVFMGAGRQRLAQLLGETYKATIGEAFNPKKYEKSITRPLQVPVVLAILMRPSLAPFCPDFEETLAVGGAVQNLHLTACALGIGCSWSTPSYLDHPNIRSFFKLEGRDKCFGFYYMGYLEGEWPTSVRGEAAEKITLIDK